MPFTTIDIVKKHLTDYRLGTKRIENEAVLMPTNGSVYLQYANIQPHSEKVKAKEIISPVTEQLSFNQDNTLTLSHTELIPDTVVVANNSSMASIYTENVDYSVDYDNGIITRITDGAIGELATVTIWYQYYRIYTLGVDYEIDYTTGRFSGLEYGNIEPGQIVLADYVSEYGNITDEAVANAITEASDKVLSIIEPSYEDSTDQSLITAETYFALAIICRIKAIEAAQNAANTVSGYRGDFWLELSSSYSNEGNSLLKPYSKSLGGFSSPSLSNSGNQCD